MIKNTKKDFKKKHAKDIKILLKKKKKCVIRNSLSTKSIS